METYDDIVIGAGHNGLTAAAYLARAGRKVLVLERSGHVGGATVSARPFPGMDARLSRYSYLVSLMPRQIITDLDLDITLIRRRYSSYTPLPADPTRGLLVDTADDKATAASFRAATGSDHDFAAWQNFYGAMATVAEGVFPTMLRPLMSADEMASVAATDLDAMDLWEQLTSTPLGTIIDSRFSDDVVRGIVATDGLIGTFADLYDPSLLQNVCLLYHLIGGGTGDWDVPVGGMGAVSGALAAAAVAAGAEIRTGVEVTAIDAEDGRVGWPGGAAAAEFIHAACAPAVLDSLLDTPTVGGPPPQGAQLKINVLLRRLPKLRDHTVAPGVAFSGTFHIHEGFDALGRSYQEAATGSIPSTPPCEIYCHTLSDPSILGPSLTGMHTLTLFGLHMPPELFTSSGAKDQAVQATLAALDSVLDEPIADVIATDINGDPCIEAKTPLELQDAVGLPGGNIFHRPLQWPWAPTSDDVGTWGVETKHPRLLIAGAGARRGGGVSGIPGHNAAAAVLGA
ncbi:NAD(P)/FAD-dependent oxidoreductase [Nocardia sp. 348MFTsu5.1]|uniref:phytoene desaturase family protein n=1 Tax=Nocardia sp. 348MFTsu5.1 TaxID=1172185 RepID=UPI00036D9A09|nr:NAD(P)/FAD-dependent oxidoreductase [Nocardia sp. 348MFTsu5.1]